MATDRPLTQRAFMQQLVARHGRDRATVCRLYAEAERSGRVERKRNSQGWSPERYAAALWADGERKGRLDSR